MTQTVLNKSFRRIGGGATRQRLAPRPGPGSPELAHPPAGVLRHGRELTFFSARVYTSGQRRGRLVEKNLKTAESKTTLSLPLALIELLQTRRRAQVAGRLAAKVWVDSDLIFTTSVGTALEPRNVKRAWDALCKRAGVKMRLHDLRHLAASLAFAAARR